MWKKIPFKGYVYASLALNSFSVLFVLAILKYLPPIIPIFYGLPVGPNQLLPTLGITLIPGVGFLTIIINTTLAIMSKDVFLKRVYIISAAFVSLLTTITTLKIILLVGIF